MKINSIEDALLTIDAIESGQLLDFEEIHFGGELEALKIVVDGPRYDAAIPAELAKGLWDLQLAFYRAAAFVLKGVDDARKLSEAQRAELEFVFEVDKGSIELKALLDKFCGVLSEGLKTMESKHRAVVLIAIVVAVAGGVVGWKALSENSQLKKTEIEANVKIENEQEKTRQFEVLANVAAREPAVKRFEKAATEGTEAVIRSAPDATTISVGRTKFDRTDIQEVNQRAARASSIASAVEDDFRVYNAETKMVDATKYVLAGTDGVDFSVIVNHSEFSAEDLEKIWRAARGRTSIRLEVSITRNKGVIKAAQIIQVF